MIIDIQQTKAERGIQFDIIINGEKTYTSVNPWFSLQAPLRLEDIRTSQLMDLQGNTRYYTDFDVIENKLHSLIHAKYLVGLPAKSRIFSVRDCTGVTIGGFHRMAKGLLKNHHVILYHNKELVGYSKSTGRFRIISIYDGEEQVALVTLCFVGKDGKFNSKVFIKPGYEPLAEILSFFTAFGCRVEIPSTPMGSQSGGVFLMRGEEMHFSYTKDRYGKYYNPNWIKDTFGQKVYDDFMAEILARRAEMWGKMKGWVIFLIIFGSVMLLGTLFLLFYLNTTLM